MIRERERKRNRRVEERGNKWTRKVDKIIRSFNKWKNKYNAKALVQIKALVHYKNTYMRDSWYATLYY